MTSTTNAAMRFGGLVRRIFGLVPVVAMVVLGAAVKPAAAQGRTVDIGFGYQFVSSPTGVEGEDDRTYPLGLNADFSIGLVQSESSRIAVVGDIGWAHHFEDPEGSHAFNITGGIRVGFGPRDRANFYVQGLYGLVTERQPQDVQSLYETDGLFLAEGGVQVPFRPRASFFAQGGLRFAQFGEADRQGVIVQRDSATGFRIVVGVRVDTR